METSNEATAEKMLAVFQGGPTRLEDMCDGRGDAVMFRWLDEASTIDEAKAIARCHGYQLIVEWGQPDDMLPADLAEAYGRGEQVFERWNPEPPEPGLIFAGKHDSEDGDIIAKWLRPLSSEEREEWQGFLHIVMNSRGSRDIALERRRQVKVEHYSQHHDDEHDDFSLSLAGILMAVHAAAQPLNQHGGAKAAEAAQAILAAILKLWPWGKEDFKPKSPRRDLVRAGALIAAEIDRLDRAERAAATAVHQEAAHD